MLVSSDASNKEISIIDMDGNVNIDSKSNNNEYSVDNEYRCIPRFSC